MSKIVSKLGFRIVIAALAVLLAIPVAAADPPSAAGVWKQINENGSVGSHVTISEGAGALFVGRITKLFGSNPNPICKACPGDLKDAPMLGLPIIQGMRRSGLSYSDGTILDPGSGTVYRAKMELSPDGKTLTVRGYIGISLIGRSQTWTRME